MKKMVLVFVAVVALSSAVPASAGPIVVDGGWNPFCFGITPGEPVSDCGSSGSPFTFTSAGLVLFKITDAFLYGDIFTVVIDGGAPFLTSPPLLVGGSESNPDAAFADPGYSKAAVLLGAGAHSIDVSFTSGPGFGTGYLEVESAAAVPDAGSALGLLGLGMIGLSTLRRKLF